MAGKNLEFVKTLEGKNSDLYEELLVLKEILLDDIHISQSATTQESLCNIEIQVHPATGADLQNKWVSVILVISPFLQYPHTMPHIQLLRPRGISQDYFNHIRDSLQAHAEKNVGVAMLYDLFETTRELLTNNNKPATFCTICLEDFKYDGKVECPNFFKTSCYHYFHTWCLVKYVRQPLESEDEKNILPCPVCRKDIKVEVGSINTNELPQKAHNDDVMQTSIPAEIKKKLEAWQKNMKVIYENQLKKGGIIDLEKEKLKSLVNISEPIVSVECLDVSTILARSLPSRDDNNNNSIKACGNGARRREEASTRSNEKNFENRRFYGFKNMSSEKYYNKNIRNKTTLDPCNRQQTHSCYQATSSHQNQRTQVNNNNYPTERHHNTQTPPSTVPDVLNPASNAHDNDDDAS